MVKKTGVQFYTTDGSKSAALHAASADALAWQFGTRYPAVVPAMNEPKPP